MVVFSSVIFLKLFQMISNDTGYILNLTSVLFASFGIGFLFLFLNELTRKKDFAFFCSIIFSFLPIFLSVTVYAKGHSFAFFYAMIALYYLVKYVNKGKVLDAILFSLFFLAGLLCRNTNLAYLPAIVGIIFYKKINITNLKKLVPVVVTMIFYFLLRFKNLLYWRGATVFYLENILFMRQRIVDGLYNSISFFGFFLIIFFIYLARYDKELRKLALFSILWFIPYFSIIIFATNFSVRYLIPVLAPIIMVMGASISYLFRRKKILGIICLLVLIISFSLKMVPILDFRHQYCGPKEFAEFVMENTENDSVIISNDESVFFTYYANRTVIGYSPYPTPAEHRTTILKFIELLKSNTSLYVTGAVYYTPIPNDVLNKNFIIEEVGSAVNEEYRHAELNLRTRIEPLFRIKLNESLPMSEYVIRGVY